MNEVERREEIKRLLAERPIRIDTAAKILNLMIWKEPLE